MNDPSHYTPRQVRNFIIEAFKIGEHAFYERAIELLPTLQMHSGVDAAALMAFEAFLRECDQLPSRASRFGNLIRRAAEIEGGERDGA